MMKHIILLSALILFACKVQAAPTKYLYEGTPSADHHKWINPRGNTDYFIVPNLNGPPIYKEGDPCGDGNNVAIRSGEAFLLPGKDKPIKGLETALITSEDLCGKASRGNKAVEGRILKEVTIPGLSASSGFNAGINATVTATYKDVNTVRIGYPDYKANQVSLTANKKHILWFRAAQTQSFRVVKIEQGACVDVGNGNYEARKSNSGQISQSPNYPKIQAASLALDIVPKFTGRFWWSSNPCPQDQCQ